MTKLKLTIAIILLSTTLLQAQINNAKTATVKVYGNCGMCETSIEKAAGKKKISKADWNEETKLATIIYDSEKTNLDAVLKNIAIAGYDNQSFLAPDVAYNILPDCCKYNREMKAMVKVSTKDTSMSITNHTGHNQANMETTTQHTNQQQAILENYLAVKDALVKTDAITTAEKATALLASLNNIDMAKMKMDDHVAFMKVEKLLKIDAATISSSKDVAVQRKAFSNLSTNMIAFVKVTKATGAVYVQHCPMANDGKGANWLSKQNAVKNPYYGNSMLTCGKTVETIK